MEYVISSTEELLDIILSGFLELVLSLFFYLLLGFVLAVFSMVFVNRKKWFKRKNQLWNFITNFHYLFILVAFMATAPLLGISRFSHSMASDLVDNYLEPTIKSQIDSIKDQLIESWPEEMMTIGLSIDQAVDQMIESIHYKADPDEYFAEEKTDVVNWFVDDLAHVILSYTLDEMIVFSSESNGAELEQGEGNISLANIENTNYSIASDSIAKSVSRSTQYYLNSYFTAQYSSIFILFLTLLAYPIIETLLYYWIVKNKKSDLIAG